ncbi:MAG: transglycosylase domain-containing protein, partial [Propionibacteriaceae bacterium]
MPPTRNADMKGTKAYAAVMFVVISVISGLLLSGLLVPFVAVGGAGANAVAEAMNNLPAEFEAPDQFQGSKLVLADGTLLATIAEQDRKYVALDQINPLLRKAQIAIEDHRFYQHGALDVRGFMRALIKGGGGQGGSTLSQQYVKQVQIQIALDSGDKQAEKKAQERTLSRKVQELRRAMAIERKYSKDQILERYLNIAYYGDGSYGVESAAQHYFGVSAKDVTLEQAALIAGMVQNPSATDPVNHPKAALERRDMVLQRMSDPLVADELAKIAPTDVVVTKEQTEKAQEIPFDKTKVKARADGCVASPYPFICDYATRELLKTTSLRGTSSNAAEARQNALNILNRKGLTIKLSVDNRFQESATRHLNEFVAPTDPVIGTMSSVEPGTGRIVMMVQSRPTMGSDAGAGETFYNYNVSEDFGGAEGYQAGSTFKVFAAAAAFDKGIPMSKVYNSPS